MNYSLPKCSKLDITASGTFEKIAVWIICLISEVWIYLKISNLCDSMIDLEGDEYVAEHQYIVFPPEKINIARNLSPMRSWASWWVKRPQKSDHNIIIKCALHYVFSKQLIASNKSWFKIRKRELVSLTFVFFCTMKSNCLFKIWMTDTDIIVYARKT